MSFGTIEIYGAGIDATILRQIGLPGPQIGSMNSIIKVPNGSLKLDNVTLADGCTGASGGAIHVEIWSSSLHVSNTKFINNQANDSKGGGDGGAIYNVGIMTLSNVYFTGNTAKRGGAIFNFSAPTTGLAVTANNVDFHDNEATHSGGGAIYNDQISGTLKIRQSNFRVNTSTYSGGIREHVFSERTDIVTINAKKNYWNNPTVSASSNVQGANTQEMLTAKVNFTPDPPQVPPVDPCGLRQCPVPTSTPTQTATPDPISMLAPYGVVPENVTGMPTWSYAELIAVKNGVAAIGLAFANHIGGNISPVDAFRLMMGVNTSGLGPIKVRRTDAPGCIYYIGSRVIECGNLEDMDGNPRAITEYVIVHEMGHVFTGETARGNNISLAEYINGTRTEQLADARGPVMGNFIQNDGDTVFRWGERGWGSGPGSNYTPNDDRNGEPIKRLFTDFQQNPAPYIPVPPDQRTSIEIAVDETAADMFLNWVYKSIDPSRGFVNKSWKPTDIHPATPNAFCNTTPGCPESNPLVAGQTLLGNSGDARMAWMQQKMEDIFVDHGWK